MFEEICTDTLIRYQALASIAQAIIALAVAVFGGVWAIFHFRLAGFRPKGYAWIDEHRLAIKVKITNRGRTEGTVPRPNIVQDSGGRVLPVRWVVSPEPTALGPKHTVEYLAEHDCPFPNTTLVRFTFNEDQRKDVTPRSIGCGTWPRPTRP